MEQRLLRTFQQQVLLQCRFILLAADEVNAGLQRCDVTLTFYALQNLLNAAANVSKALWGSGGNLAHHRKTLRDSIGVADDSPLRAVTMRNNYEHFDERIDRWWSESRLHNSVDLSLMPPPSIGGIDARIDWFRVFDPTTGRLIFWGQDFDVQELIDEVQRILPKLTEEASKPHSAT